MGSSVCRDSAHGQATADVAVARRPKNEVRCVDGLHSHRVTGQLGVAIALIVAAVIRFDRNDLTR